MDMIYSKPNGEEVGFLTDYTLDLEVGGNNDFQIDTPSTSQLLDFDYSVYINGTEYGGVVSKIVVDTKSKKISYIGQTWRGLLSNYIIKPDSGQDYKTVSGTASNIISALISGFGIGGRYSVTANNDITVSNYQFDRYCTLLDGITKMLKSVNARLNVVCNNGAVTLSVVPIHDYSDELEYSQDNDINFKITDNRDGVNHLICLGKGELQARQVVDLYVLSDGTISDTTQYYTGMNERAQTYDYSSVESLDELKKSGREKLAELQNSQKLEMAIGEINVELGDIVGGRERITGIVMAKPISKKIVKISNDKLKISYEVT